MSFDLSRKKFNPLDSYSQVVMQQGRVQTDADWNTMLAQISRHNQAEGLDTFGPSVVPRTTPDGFLITGPSNAINIGPGRIYVDGVLAENYTETLKWDARLAELSGTAKLSGADVDAAPSGLVGTTAYSDQPYYPTPPTLPQGEPYLVYVDVWQRDITYLQDASLVDVAIGVDTTARQQTVWQVKYLANIGDLEPNAADADIPGWLETIHPSSARLSTATGEIEDQDSLCLLPPQAGYKGLENQLYRVQVHDAGPAGSATFKWSRDNAIVASRVSAISSSDGITNIVVDSLGRDEMLSFKEGDWVEITDDHRDLKGQAGELRRIKLGGGINPTTRTITLDGNPLPLGSGNKQFLIVDDNQTEPSHNTRIIRWDQAGTVFRENGSEYTNLDANTSDGLITIPAAGTRLFLERGILVDFSLEEVVDEADFEAEFKTGDYWTIAARVNDATVELLDRAPPEGIHHHYAKLAIVDNNDITDYRTLWPPMLEGQGCACSVCVSPEAHNNGTATIQQAIDQVISQGGGTVCLSVGEYHVDQPIKITGNSVTLRGQGWQTRLISRKQSTLIEIGNEDGKMATDIAIDNLFCLTSTVRGSTAALTAHNVFGLTLTACLVINAAIERGTSLGIQLGGIIARCAIKECEIAAEQAIIGPRLKEDYLLTMDFSISNCLILSKQLGISFTELSFHLGKLAVSNNTLSTARHVGIELTGQALDNTSISIENNILQNCLNGIRSGLSNVRILCNDIESDYSADHRGNAIQFVDGFAPEDNHDLQVIGNRIRNYAGHAIAVRDGIGKIMVKQNQISNIFGSAFIVLTAGSVEYLSLENNQFSEINGNLHNSNNVQTALHIHASLRADISNNVFDGVVQSSNNTAMRAAITVATSRDVRISGNRLFKVTPNSYSGGGFGIFIKSSVGHFEINNNAIHRVDQNELVDQEENPLYEAIWRPLAISMRPFKPPVDQKKEKMEVHTTMEDSMNKEAAYAMEANAVAAAPMIYLNNLAYAAFENRVIKLGKPSSNVTVNANRFYATSSRATAVLIITPNHCSFIDNEVTNTSSEIGMLVALLAETIGANNNRLIGTSDRNSMLLKSPHYVVMGNISSGNIVVDSDSGGTLPIPAPWNAINIIT